MKSFDPQRIEKFRHLYEERTISDYSSRQHIHPFISDFLEKKLIQATGDYIQPKDYVLEVGCGEGTFTFPTAERCKHVDAIDIVEGSIATIRSICTNSGIHNITPSVASIYDYSPDSHRYDRILFSRSLSQMPFPQHALLLSREMLKQSGSVIVVEHEIFPDPDGSQYPEHLERVKEVYSEVFSNQEISYDQFLTMFLIPWVVSEDWFYQLASATKMEVRDLKKVQYQPLFFRPQTGYVVDFVCKA